MLRSVCPGCDLEIPLAKAEEAAAEKKSLECSSCETEFAPHEPEPEFPPASGDAHPGAVLRDEAIARVDKAADLTWKQVALDVAQRIARNQSTLTTDDVWKALDGSGLTTPEPRAMGAIMRRLAKAGVIKNTYRTLVSDRPECHRRPLTVWQSCI